MSEAKVETTPQTVAPKPGERFTDAGGRHLRVDEVNLADPLDRQVVGRVWPSEDAIADGGTEGRDYSTTLPTWKAVWLDKAPPRERQAGDLG